MKQKEINELQDAAGLRLVRTTSGVEVWTLDRRMAYRAKNLPQAAAFLDGWIARAKGDTETTGTTPDEFGGTEYREAGE